MTIFRAACPSCKVKINVSETGNDLTRVTCDVCGKIFDVRLPKNPPERAAQPNSPFTLPLSDFVGTLPNEALDWNNYRVRRKPFIAVRPLAISIGIVAVLGTTIGIGTLVLQQSSRIDFVAIGGSIVNGPEDSRELILQDWLRYLDEQKTILQSITRKSDCVTAMIPMERLQEKQLRLLVRAALMDSTELPAYKVSDLPPAPSLVATSDRNFRSIEAVLTPEFREAEKALNTYAIAVLSYLHVEATGLPSPKNEFEKLLFTKISEKRGLCRLLAGAHRSANESKTAIAIYELAEELKRLRSTSEPIAKIESIIPPSYLHADGSADRLRTALARRFIGKTDNELARAIAVIERCFGEMDLRILK